MSPVSFEVIERADRLAALGPEWWDLWRRVPAALPFQSPAWLLPWWRHFAPGALFTLAARRDDRLVGLAPGYIEHGPLGRRILPLGISLSDHLDILVDPACRTEATGALAAAAQSRAGDWDLWGLEELPPGAEALAMTLPPGCADRLEQQSPCPVLTLTKADDGAVRLPRRKRQHLNLARNRAARQGEIRVEQADARTLDSALEALFRLHRQRWESRGGEGALASEAVQAFQREAAPQLQEAGLLRLYTLSIAGQVAAVHYGLAHGSRHYVYLTGFDPAFQFESPGVILLAHAIEQALAEGLREVDFLRGGEAYKYEWGAVDRWNVKRSIRQDAHG